MIAEPIDEIVVTGSPQDGHVGEWAILFNDSPDYTASDTVRTRMMATFARGDYSEAMSIMRHSMGMSEKEIARFLRQQANRRGAELVKKFKDLRVGTGARSGRHGTPHARAGAQLMREANLTAKNSKEYANHLRVVARQLINQKKQINH
ncbi:MAG: hypothetical protein U5K76_12520 [Woeseiaceae bacterium]|nr:hypothetical protein [Woeseiaceae bacterium]